jgi:hypothetical protein
MSAAVKPDSGGRLGTPFAVGFAAFEKEERNKNERNRGIFFIVFRP